MKAKTVKEGLIATKWILENRGWCQTHYHADKNGVRVGDPITDPAYGGSCLFGALSLVEYDEDAFGLATLTRMAVHNKVLDEPLAISIPDWNDDKTRTKSQVIALLDKLIKEVP
jgi:hypothetical protein